MIPSKVPPAETQIMSASEASPPDNQSAEVEIAATESNSEVPPTPLAQSLCNSVQPKHAAGQVAYNGIYPGITSSQELKALLGEPEEIITHPPSETWNYLYEDTNTYYSVLIENDVVARISITLREQERQTVQDVIEYYACPDVVVAIDEAEEPAGLYNGTFLVYQEYGVEFFISQFPISLTDRVFAINYFVPETQGNSVANSSTITNEDSAIVLQFEDVLVQP